MDKTIIEMLSESPTAALSSLKSQGKNYEVINDLIKELEEKDRNIRDTQVGRVQKDKVVKKVNADGNLESSKVVKSVKISAPFQKKIVSNAVAFEVGEPVTLTPNTSIKDNTLANLVLKLWKVNRIDAKLQELKRAQKAQTQSAIVFYTSEIKEGALIQKILSTLGIKDQKKEIKSRILDNKKGRMYPYFDEYGDMKAFVWEYSVTNTDNKTTTYTNIYDDKNVYKISSENPNIFDTEVHGFSKIPVVYLSQDKSEWFDVADMIDRLEVSLSKHGGSNDYSGHPMLKIFGEVKNAPDKDDDGKAWIIPKTFDDDGKEIVGDVQFLTNDNAPDSIRLELDKLEDLIYALSNTPNLSFNNVKGISNVSGIALKLMFLDSIIKAKMNEGENRTIIERIINVMISGITTTTNTKLRAMSNDLYFDVTFNSILPDDLKEAVETVVSAKGAGVMSTKTAVEYINLNGDTEEELELIKDETNSKLQNSHE